VLTDAVVGDLAPITIHHPPGTYPLTPASRISLRAIVDHRDLFRGVGLDWGAGTGCLAVLAAKLPDVRHVTALEIGEDDVRIARVNAERNGVSDRVTVIHADSYEPRTAEGRDALDRLVGAVDFVLANPPASPGDDGFTFRRRALCEARRFVKPGAVAMVQASAQYGAGRIEGLARDAPGFVYTGLLATTDWIEFDQSRPDLEHQVDAYAQEEARGGLPYPFGDPRDGGATIIDARQALELYRRTGKHPLSKWQAHGFRFIGC